MKHICFLFVLVSLIGSGTLQAQTTPLPTDLPDISVIGNFLTTQSKDKKSFEVKEIEFSFQHYLHPSVKADVFTALHKEASRQRNFELEEAFITFSDLYGVMVLDDGANVGLGAIIGKKFLGIGKLNALHPEQWQFVDRPIAIKQFFGGEEALSGEGGQLNYLLPLSFFSQLEVGYWSVSAHEEDSTDTENTEHAHGVAYRNSMLNGRLWNSFEVSNSQEFEVGLSYVVGNASASSTDDKSHVFGGDLTFSQEFNLFQTLKLQAEVYHAKYGEEGESRESQSGGFISSFYTFNPYVQAGIRFGTLSSHGNEGTTTNQWAFLATRQLTETSKFKVQYNTGENIDMTIYAQFIFGMGPHAHVLH